MNPFLLPFAPFYTPDWRASDAALDCIEAVLFKYRPGSILEFGPGLSSFLFYRYAAKNPGVSYLVYDHESSFAYEHAARVDKAGFSSLNINILQLNASQGYDFIDSVLPTAAFIFIDGPPSSEARWQLAKPLSEPRFDESIFLIDDTHRANENELAEHLAAGRRQHSIQDILFPPRRSTLLIPRNAAAKQTGDKLGV